MVQICKKDKEKVYNAIRTGKIDAADMSFSNLIDDIILCLAVAAKLKQKISLTDVPFAITEAEVLAELGWNLWDNEWDVNKGIFAESVMRKLLAKYTSDEWLSFYNRYVQKHVMEKLGIRHVYIYCFQKLN